MTKAVESDTQIQIITRKVRLKGIRELMFDRYAGDNNTKLPWAIEFELDIMPNKEIKEQEIYNLFVEGGLAIGLGTFRGVYGKFLVEKWE